jgi:hypothetical protein
VALISDPPVVSVPETPSGVHAVIGFHLRCLTFARRPSLCLYRDPAGSVLTR